MNFAATLLFAFVPRDEKKMMHLCEERIFAFTSDDEFSAYKEACDLGRNISEENRSNVDDKDYVFVGVVELVELTLDNDIDGEVWHRYVDRKSPLERLHKLLPQKDKLSVFRRLRRFGDVA